MSHATMIGNPPKVVDCNDFTKVSPVEFASILTSRDSVERVESLPANLVGLRDCSTGSVYVVEYSELARYQAAELGHADRRSL